MITYSTTLAASNMIFPAPLLGILQGIADDIPRYEKTIIEQPSPRKQLRGTSPAAKEMQEKILTIIKERGKIGSVEIGKLVDRGRCCVYDHCSQMVIHGRVKLIQERKIFYWVAL